ncbi:MAG: hypothetical protein Q9218_003687 [Villophora microphyllina]
MANSSQILDLLAADDEPGQAAYLDICRAVLSKPERLSDLVREDEGSALVFLITRNRHRFVHLLSQIFCNGRQLPKDFPLKPIAAATIGLFRYVVPKLPALDTAQLVNLLLPALRACFTSGVLQVRYLASTLIQAKGVAEQLVTDPRGAQAVITWTCSAVCHSQDGPTLEAWTITLMAMIQKCATNHNMDEEIARWSRLQNLKESLIKLKHREEIHHAIQSTRKDLPALANMKPLTLDQKKESTTKSQDPVGPLLQIDADLSNLLTQFELPIPKSARKLTEVIGSLEVDKTIAILKAISSSFPCNVCKGVLQAHVHNARSIITPEQFDQNTLMDSTLQSQVISDMSPELPYKLSDQEVDIISHWATPSLIIGRSGTGKTTCLISRLLAKYLASTSVAGQRPLRQVLVTRSANLAQKIRVQVHKSLKSLTTGSSEDELPKSNLDEDCLNDISKATLLTMTDEVFPYVCTFEHFLRLLENTVASIDPQHARTNEALKGAPNHGPTKQTGDIDDGGNCVDYPAFELDYWGQFPREITRDIPVSLAFAEIMGVIKGCTKSGRSITSLTYGEYLGQSSRMAPTFTLEAERAKVYRIFETYEKVKDKRQQVDYVDRVNRILRALRSHPTLTRLVTGAFDEIYVDEVQDQRSVDIELFLSIVSDGRGFHAAGDNAQAISQESTFRFEDVKALVYEHFSDRGRQEFASPTMFKLGVNYRSHDGIIKLASLVMDLLWKAFPETVDKMEPEKGLTNGPLPIMFVSCEPQLLADQTFKSSALPARTASFGSEQVILVRNQQAKIRLRRAIGDVALILTIVQSKGMEFNDVILYDFFSTCTDPAGLRQLPFLLGSHITKFDPVAHAAMCVELKHLYVAITRARLRLFFLETSHQKDLIPVIRIMTKSTPKPLIQVIMPDDLSFNDHIRSLHADDSQTPQRWAERGSDLMDGRQFDEAYLCFQRAADEQGMRLAKANSEREKGRRCLAENNLQGAAQGFQSAADLFLQSNRVGDAAAALRMMGWTARAAELWYIHGKYEKAALLFVEAGLYRRAADCHIMNLSYSEAAALLWQGEEYDALVRCLVQHRASIPDDVCQHYGSLCKFMLAKQKSTSGIPTYTQDVRQSRQAVLRGAAIRRAAGSEAFDWELGRGLQLLHTKGIAEQLRTNHEAKVTSLIDYTVTSRLAGAARYGKTLSAHLLKGLSKSNNSVLQDRVDQWKLALTRPKDQSDSQAARMGIMDDPCIRMIINIQSLNPEAIASATSLESLLTVALHDAILAVQSSLMGDASTAAEAMLISCGVWSAGKPRTSYINLSWSPFFQSSAFAGNSDVVSMCKAHVAEKFAESILSLHKTAKEIWRITYPQRCVHFLRGNDLISEQRLLWLNALFCSLTSLYYRRAMNEKFNEKFLKIRRSWQERLLSETTWISAFEQDGKTLADVLHSIRYDEALSGVSTGLEQLLFHRLRHEWQQRREFSPLLEQVQLATTLGVQNRLFRALPYLARLDHQKPMAWEHVRAVVNLEREVGSPDFSAFTFRICSTGFVIPRSWLALQLPRIHGVAPSGNISALLNKVEYQDRHCELIVLLCDILGWMDTQLPPSTNFNIGTRSYQRALIQPRHSQLLAVALVNLKLSGAPSQIFVPMVHTVNQILRRYNTGRDQLEYRNNHVDLCKQLATAFIKYNGKDALIYVRRTSAETADSRRFKEATKLESMTLDQAVATYVRQPPTQPRDGQDAVPASVPNEHYTTAEVDQIITWQRRWRQRLPVIRRRRAWMQTAKAQQIGRYQKWTVNYGNVLRYGFLDLLVAQGTPALALLSDTQEKCTTIQQKIMLAVETATDEAVYGKLEKLLSGWTVVETALSTAAGALAEEKLQMIIDQGDVSALKTHLKDTVAEVDRVEGDLVGIEIEMADVLTR